MVSKRRRWRYVRRLYNIEPFENAFVRFGANKRTFAIIKEAPAMRTLPKPDMLEKALLGLTEAVSVLKAGQPDQAAQDKLFEQFDSIADLLLPPDPTPLATADCKTLKQLLEKIEKSLTALALQAQSTDYGLSDQTDAIIAELRVAKEMASTVEAASSESESASPPPAVVETLSEKPELAVETPKPAEEPLKPAETPPAETVTAAAAAVLPTSTPAEPPKAETPVVEPLKPAEPTAAVAAAPATEVEAEKAEGHKTPPKGYPQQRSQYADPDNYKYPLDTEEHVRAAISYFSKPENYKSYGSAERAAVWGRIKRAAAKYDIKLSETTGVSKEMESACDVITRADMQVQFETWTKSASDQLKATLEEALKPVAALKSIGSQMPGIQALTNGSPQAFKRAVLSPIEEMDLSLSPDLANIDEYGNIKS